MSNDTMAANCVAYFECCLTKNRPAFGLTPAERESLTSQGLMKVVTPPLTDSYIDLMERFKRIGPAIPRTILPQNQAAFDSILALGRPPESGEIKAAILKYKAVASTVYQMLYRRRMKLLKEAAQ